jgi:hypothetical protein
MPVQNFENLDTNTDVTTTRTLLHEVIPLTGTIISGAYSDANIKNYTHGMFQSVYDYPYLSSSANHIFDITAGYDETSILSASTSTQNTKKINLYNQYSQVLLGYTGSTTDGVRKFENDLTLDGTGAMKECFFFSFSRLLVKDQIKKGSFSLSLGTGSWATPFAGNVKVYQDISASATTNTNNTVGGDYGLLYLSGGANRVEGVVFYQAGIVVLSSSVWSGVSDFYSGSAFSYSPAETLVSASISGSADALRHRIQNLSFNNTTEINSKIYFCRVPHNKYNYSSNPTYTSGSKIRVKEVASDTPRAYITTVGLYNSQNELLATAKLSEPLMKDPSNELILRVRLDY